MTHITDSVVAHMSCIPSLVQVAAFFLSVFWCMVMDSFIFNYDEKKKKWKKRKKMFLRARGLLKKKIRKKRGKETFFPCFLIQINIESPRAE